MTNNVKMDTLKAISALSAFNWYKITENTEDGNRTFYATGLEAQFDGEAVKANRQFATPVYLTEYSSVTAAAENIIVFHLPNGGSYTVEGQHKDFSKLNSHTERKAFRYIDDLANAAYINTAWTQYNKEEGVVTLVVDPYLMGELSSMAHEQVKSIIDRRLYGENVKGCRTVCFKIKVNEPYKKIFPDVFDLEKNACANCAPSHIMCFNENLEHSMKAKEVNRYLALWELAQSVTTAI